MTSLILQSQSLFIFGCIFFCCKDLSVLAVQKIYDINCYDVNDKGVTYNGTANTTESGYTCKNWKVYHSNYTFYYQDHNYCRNPRPDDFKRPWCYTGNDHAFRLCYIEACDNCTRNPCLNGGTCALRTNGHTCTCGERFYGMNCQYDISKCFNATCLNGGICKEKINGGYQCICPRGYRGDNCEQGPAFKVAPQIILNNKLTIDEGSSIIYIPCFVAGIPRPSIKWESIDKTSMPSNARQVLDILFFENVTLADSGFYMCTAKNAIGTDVKVVHIIIKAKPPILHTGPIIHALSTVKVYYYTDARLQCNVSGFPKPTVTWKHGNKVLQTSGNIIVVQNVTNTTAGQYTCIATNDVGTSQVNIYLKVTYDTPKIVTHPKAAVITLGQFHNFSCTAIGHPKPAISWSFKSFAQESTIMPFHSLHQDGQVLTLYAQNILVSGTLTCTAVNEFGDDKASVAVIFKTPINTGFG